MLITKVEYNGNRHYMAVAFSEDGIHSTKPLEWPRYNPAADTHNFAMRDPRTGKFLLFTRIWKNGLRICARSESTDFINWTEPAEVLRGDGFASQVYSMVVFPYEGLYLGMASMYHNGDTEAGDFDTVDVELKYSTKSDAWESVAPGGRLIPRGKGAYPQGEFDCGCIYAAAPVEIDGKLWIYYMGGNGRHSDFRETSFARGWLEKDKLAGYVPRDPGRESRLVTSHFCLSGEDVSILADVEDGGTLAVGLGTKSGTIYEGFEKENCLLTRQADGYYKIEFPGRSLLELRSEPVSFQITFRKAKVYAIKGALENHMLKY